ncbi:MAG: hypothetical protein GY851_31490, partial [bacterium]|nr:hypothetical protein [bacterium]
ATGDWETRALHKTLDREGSYTLKNDHAVAFGAAYEKNRDAHVPVTTNIQSTVLNRRLVAIDIEGKLHAGGSYSSGGNVLHSSTYAFDVPLSRITEFRFETRPYIWVEFRNVSLRPGQDAGLQIHLAATYDPVAGGGTAVAPSRPEAPAQEPDPTLSQRVESGKILSELGKSLAIYANDHDGTYPRALADVEFQRLEIEQMRWLRANVAYLGRGKTVDDAPDLILAYDKALLTDGDGTNVLYNSYRVAFKTPADLAALGLPPRNHVELPNGVTVELLAYSWLSPAGGLIWYDPEGQETTIPGVYEADVEGLGTVLAFRIEPPEAHVVAEVFRGPDAQDIEKPWRLPESNLWLLPLGEERRFANLRLV